MVSIKPHNPLSISSIHIEKLFGTFNYNIPNDKNIEISRLLILYGDNGTGKTTILKLLFYLLSTKEKSGYKTILAETKFKKISITFQNGFEIGAMREDSLIGSYNFYLSKKKKIIKSILLKTNSRNSIQIEGGTEEYIVYNEILDYLRELKITTFYLSDDRKILNSITSERGNDEQKLFINDDVFYTKTQRNKIDGENLTLEETIEKFYSWVRNKMIAGSKAGEKDSQAIFSDIITKYITLSSTEPNTKTKDILLKDLKNLETKLPPYVDLGLIDLFESTAIRQSIKRATTNEQFKFLNTVITPFIDGINAKLNALETVEYTLNLFLKTVNDYFTNKTISFNLNTGFSLKQIDSDDIEFGWLSSGEKQLLLLLINIITSADDATIYIIDEPEISLNIKWQRKLMKTLLEFSSNKNIQFIIATHSFEILAGHKNNISTLTNN